MSGSLLIIISSLMSLQVSVPEPKTPAATVNQKSVTTTPAPVIHLKHRGGWDGN